MTEINTILIVEDEALVADQLALWLEEIGYDVVAIVGEAHDVLRKLDQNNIDLIFLDINLEDKLDGVDIAHQVNNQHQIPFIYISSNTDPATLKRMSMTQPVSFITKPFRIEAIKAAIELAQNYNKAAPEVDNVLFVKNGHVWEKIQINGVLYIEAQDNYAAIYLEGGGRKLVLMTMKNMVDQLPVHKFIRVHRSYIINIDKVDTVGPKSVTIGAVEIPLSDRGKELIFRYIRKI